MLQFLLRVRYLSRCYEVAIRRRPLMFHESYKLLQNFSYENWAPYGIQIRIYNDVKKSREQGLITETHSNADKLFLNFKTAFILQCQSIETLKIIATKPKLLL